MIQWEPVRPKASLSERIAAQIDHFIDGARLRAGDRLPPERDLAVRLGVSRPSLREALKTLEAQGRVQVRHGQGVFISEPSSHFHAALAARDIGLRELFAMREVLEVPAAGWAAEAAHPEDLPTLLALLDQLDVAAVALPPDYQLLRKLDRAFHLQVAAMARNRFLARTMEVLQEMLGASMATTLSIPGRLARSRRDHRRIARAIAAGDAAAARNAMRRHIRDAQTAAFARVEAEGAAPDFEKHAEKGAPAHRA